MSTVEFLGKRHHEIFCNLERQAAVLDGDGEWNNEIDVSRAGGG
jgi:hypothetical protein